MSATPNTSRSSGSGQAVVVPPATCMEEESEDDLVIVGHPALPDQARRLTRRRSWTLDERRRELTESVYRLTRLPLNLTLPRLNDSTIFITEAEAIERLRALNDDPESLTGQRLRSLELVEADLAQESFREEPIAHIVDDLFSRLDLALFDGQLKRRYVTIGTSEYAHQAARAELHRGAGVKITLSRPYYDEQLREKVSSDVRIWDAVTSVVHEMCHAYLRVLSGWGNRDDVAYYGGKVAKRGHGVIFGQVTYIMQKVLAYRGWKVDLSEGGRYPMYALQSVVAAHASEQ